MGHNFPRTQRNMKCLIVFTAVASVCWGQPSGSIRLPSGSLRIPNNCETTTGSTCVFPFTYKGVSYSQCTYADSSLPWCATATDSSGAVVTNNWGDCVISSTSSCQEESTTSSPVTTTTTTTTTSTTTASPSCSVVSGPAAGSTCVFPFSYAGVTHNSCAEWIYGGTGTGSTWCSTLVDSSGVHVNGQGNYGFCGPDCASPKSTGEVFSRRGSSSDSVVFGDDQKSSLLNNFLC